MEQAVIPLVEGDAVVVCPSRQLDLVVELAVSPPVMVELELERLVRHIFFLASCHWIPSFHRFCASKKTPLFQNTLLKQRCLCVYYIRFLGIFTTYFQDSARLHPHG